MSITNTISLNILHGGSQVGSDDRARAEAAAYATIKAAGTTVDAAFAEYRRQWDEFDDMDKLTGLARVWTDAEAAADLALTEGWHNTAGASCSLAA